MKKYLFGVSPAYFLSKFGDNFTPDNVADSLSELHDLGMNNFQCEIVDKEKLKLWENGGAVKVSNSAIQNSLNISQFVAHFMLHSFCSKEVLCSDHGLDEMKQVFTICDILNFHGQVTVPMGPVDYLPEEKQALTDALREKFTAIMELAKKTNNKIAVEVQPGALIQGAKEISEFISSVSPDLGYNYDTGHAWASGASDVEKFPLMFTEKMYGTHLCDNDSIENLSLCPTEGTINWNGVIKNLVLSNYSGSFDLEIFTSPDFVREKYLKGKAVLSNLLESVY